MPPACNWWVDAAARGRSMFARLQPRAKALALLQADRMRQQLLGNGHQLHVGSAFINLADLSIAKVLFGRIVAHITITAKDLYALAGDLLGHLRHKVFG